MKVLTAKETIAAIVDAKTPALKTKAKRLLTRYVNQQEGLGHEPRHTRGAIKAVITRDHESQHNIPI